MSCPFCGSPVNKVVDKRAVSGSGEIRRRRECLKCAKRFTTYESVARIETVVIKKDGRHQAYDQAKLRVGIERALEKRPAFSEVEAIVNRVEAKLKLRGAKEIPSQQIGKAVLSELKRVDKVAYLRFASVYRQFDNPGDFARELTTLGV